MIHALLMSYTILNYACYGSAGSRALQFQCCVRERLIHNISVRSPTMNMRYLKFTNVIVRGCPLVAINFRRPCRFLVNRGLSIFNLSGEFCQSNFRRHEASFNFRYHVVFFLST